MKKQFLSFLTILFATAFAISQEKITIEQLSSDPVRFHHEEVMFEGHITRYVAGTATTSSYYEIQGDYGARVRVNTSEPAPKINHCYVVVGAVTLHNGEALVIERRKSSCSDGLFLTVNANPYDAGTVTPSGRIQMEAGQSVQLQATARSTFKFENWTIDNRIISTQPNISIDMPSSNTVITANFKRDLSLFYIGGGILVLIIIAVILIFALKRTKSSPPHHSPYPEDERFAAAKEKPAPSQGGGETIAMNVGQNYSTVKLQTQAPATVKFIPGELEIINGLDKGKSFKMAGYPTPDGSVATIGRDHDGWENIIDPERQYAHIRLKDESNTLSRMQAELIHRGGKLYLKNLSKVNPPKVDGEDVPVNEVVEVKPDAVIKAGFIEFRYKL